MGADERKLEFRLKNASEKIQSILRINFSFKASFHSLLEIY